MSGAVEGAVSGGAGPAGETSDPAAHAPSTQDPMRSMPLDSPLYELDPLRGVEYWGCRALIALFSIACDISEILPEGVRAAGEQPLGMVLVAEYGASTLGRYSELTSFVQVRTPEGTLAMYVPYIYVTNDAALAAGREVIGAPKKLAAIELADGCDAVQGTLERPAGKRLVTLTVKPSRRLEPELLAGAMPPGTPCLSLRHLPAPPGGTLVHELVQWSSELSLHSDAKGDQCAFAGAGSLTYDSPSAIDPVHRLAVGSMIATAYIEFDMRLSAGRVIRSESRLPQVAVPSAS